jgi:hypothetical protein
LSVATLQPAQPHGHDQGPEPAPGHEEREDNRGDPEEQPGRRARSDGCVSAGGPTGAAAAAGGRVRVSLQRGLDRSEIAAANR